MVALCTAERSVCMCIPWCIVEHFTHKHSQTYLYVCIYLQQYRTCKGNRKKLLQAQKEAKLAALNSSSTGEAHETVNNVTAPSATAAGSSSATMGVAVADNTGTTATTLAQPTTATATAASAGGDTTTAAAITSEVLL